MAGIDTDFQGEARATEGVSIGFLPQEPRLDKKKTVHESIQEGISDFFALLRHFEEISTRYSEEPSEEEMQTLIARQIQIQEAIDERDLWDLEARLKMAMEALQCPPETARVATQSGGERRRVALWALFLEQSDLLLLDEPTNHIDAETVSWLESFLKTYPGTVVVVTHDRYFLDDVSAWILELEHGHAKRH